LSTEISQKDIFAVSSVFNPHHSITFIPVKKKDGAAVNKVKLFSCSVFVRRGRKNCSD